MTMHMTSPKSLKEMLRYASPEENEGDPVDLCEDTSRRSRRWPISRRYMEAALQDICEYNDISEDQLVSAPESITSIEMFLYNFPHICCMSFFPNLVSLSLVQQNLLSIEGLHYCPHLELLRLSENSIQRIEGLGNCLKLKELFLHSNRITRITNISHLTALEVLWLSNNEIRWVEGLDNLPLKELSLAHNPITQLGEILNMKALEFLNVAGTNIGSFKEIGNLTRLKNLKDLRFSDAQWGSSPLALLHNYQLQSLDTVDLTDERKQAAKAMYTRKRVYYNMCIKSLQQSRNNSTNSSLKVESRRIKSLQKTLAKLIKTHKDLEKEISEASEMENPGKGDLGAIVTVANPSKSEEWWIQIKGKVTTVDNQILHLMKRLDFLRTDMQLAKAKEQAAIDLNIHWLMVELDTGGNIRMEVGNSKDVWFKSCMDLVVSRFFAPDFVPFSITGMQVLKVTRIHNRFLQDRFERILEAQTQKGSKMHVEYLLYGETLQAPDELQWIIEEGFPFSPDHLPNGCQGPVLLSNSVGLADVCRLQALAEQSQEATWRGRATGWLLVVKTCLGSSVRDIGHAFTKNPCLPVIKNGMTHEMADGDTAGLVKKSSYPNADSVFRSHPVDSMQRSWSVFDAALVVPEYLVEFEYSFKGTDPGDGHSAAISQKGGKHSKVSAWPNGVEDKLLVSEQGVNGGWHLPLSDTEAVSLLSSGSQAHELCIIEACTAAWPHSQGGKVCLLSNEFLLRRNGFKDLSYISYLNLHNSNITGIEALRGMASLKVLVVSFNKILKITGLDDLSMLERLDLSYNLLKRIEGLSGLNNLLTLDLAGNEIWCPDDLGILQLQVPGLMNLNLRSNPLVDELGYRSLVLRALPLIAELDCNPVTTEERITSIRNFSASPASLFSSTPLLCNTLPPSASAVSLLFDEKDLEDALNFTPEVNHENFEVKVEAKGAELSEKDAGVAAPAKGATEAVLKHLADPFRLSPYRLNAFTKFHRIETASKRRINHSTKDLPAWYEGVEEVHLERRKLSTMYCFDRLPNLRRLFLSGNEISVIEGLEKCTMLEELILEDNLIKQVTGLMSLQALWRLDLGRNQLTSCVEIGNFASIEQLSIDGNNIGSLKGLEGLVCLMELYAQNNNLLQMAEINHIRELPKLMVVNLAGNALGEDNDYRMYTVYSLRKLKVLDGMNVESSELAEARNKYTGRLTRELLEECIGHNQISTLKVLDLSDQRIRHCGDVFESAELQGLTELNLNDNMISSVQSFSFWVLVKSLTLDSHKPAQALLDESLTNLEVLRVDNNSFENGPLICSASVSASLSPARSSPYPVGEEERHGNTIDAVASTSEAGLESLEVLQMGGNNITSIFSLHLSCFSKLKFLSLQDNKITKVDGLEGLHNVEQLFLNHNCIKELEPLSFAGLESLRVLHIGDNALKTLAHLGVLSALESLDLTANLLTPNRLGGLSSIDNLSSLPHLIKLWLTNNPMSRQNQYRIAVISRLEHLQQLDGRDVSEEERHEAEMYLMGAKEPTMLVLDPNVLFDSLPNSLTVTSHIKVPLKIMSLNFDTLCASQAPVMANVPGNGTRGPHSHSHGAQASSHNHGGGQVACHNGGQPRHCELLDLKHATSGGTLHRYAEMGSLFQKRSSRGKTRCL